MNRSESGRILPMLLLVIVLGGLGFLALAALRAGPAPAIGIEPGLPGIGRRTPVRVVVDEPRRGLADIRVELVQGERIEPLAQRSHRPRPFWSPWGESTARDTIEFEVGRDVQEHLVEGPATIRVTAGRAGSPLRHPAPVVVERTLEVRLRPPALQVQSSFTYVNQGGCEAVVYSVGPATAKDGVQTGDCWFPGFPMPGGPPDRRFALFAAPYDLDDPGKIRLVARDDVGNESQVAFVDKFTRRPFGRDRIDLPDAFLSRVVPSIMAQTPDLKDRGSLLDNYLMINRELRQANAKTLAELAGQSAKQFLWSRPFLPMRNAQVMAHFADRRTYFYHGHPVDQQDHLGIDQATVRRDRVEAANDGVVLLAHYLGIYGNAVDRKSVV